MAVPTKVEELVQRFDRDRRAYRSGYYNETQVRGDFVDPLLQELGWDVRNLRSFPEHLREVVEEDKVRTRTGTRAPDYGFYSNGTRKFFLEAKKPYVKIHSDTHPAFQLRRYAWSARLPLSLLTDFEELAVYDCRSEPQKDDGPAIARLDFITYDQYPEPAVWDRIYSIFSREAVLDGSLEKYAEKNKRRRGTETVDAAFLREIEGWRDALARNFALRNDLNGRGLNFAVQMTIDRLIFLRMAEDRGIEEYGRLLGLTNGANVYGRLRELFREADDRYNSGLFHFRRERGRDEEPDDLTLSLNVDDGVLRGIIRGLYYPESPYEFSVLPVDVLGQVYEQFLGKVIRLEDGPGGHNAVVEEKPEVRKAGGVYYTPTYIVDYIVKKTIGKLLEDKRPGPRGGASRLKIVDPACGSGSFLIGVYRFLLDWHRDEYVKDGPEKWSKVLYMGPGDQWHLTIDEKRRILLNNIHGVDIDPQAVEVTKLSLLLKVLEGESEASLATQLRMFQARALPDLDQNIKCGNSLVGPDFYDNEQMILLDEEEHYRINVFDWKEAFPRVFEGDNPGFDAVVGNPPYIRIHNLVDYYPAEVRHIQSNFSSAEFGKVDIYVAFAERGLSLLNEDGLLGFIVPNKFMQADYGRGLRSLIASQNSLHLIVDFRYAQVFERATTYTCLLFLTGSANKKFVGLFNSDNETPAQFLSRPVAEDFLATGLGASAWSLAPCVEAALLRKVEELGDPLPTLVELAITGVKTGANNAFTFDLVARQGSRLELRPEGAGYTVELEADLLRPYRKAESMKRYISWSTNRYILYPYTLINGKTTLIPANVLQRSFPNTWDYLNTKRLLLENRQKGKLKGPSWYGLSFSSSLRMFSARKIVTSTLAPLNAFSIDSDASIFPQGAGGGSGLVVHENQSVEYVLGVLNSKLLTFYFQRISSHFQGGYFAYEPRYLERIPVRTIDSSDPDDLSRHDQMVKLVGRMLSLHERMAGVRIARERTVLGHQIEATDRQIDRLVYELYGLTDEEIDIVEGATAR